jgi:hypothetical protein
MLASSDNNMPTTGHRYQLWHTRPFAQSSGVRPYNYNNTTNNNNKNNVATHETWKRQVLLSPRLH